MTKSKMNPKVDIYFTAGCGRCPLMNTPECKVHNWTEELESLRKIVLDYGLTEELKWSHPVYTFEKSNIVMIGAFNENCVLSFFKGALLKDANKILTKPSENTQSGRVIRFTNIQQVIEKKDIIKAYIYEAVQVEKADLKVELKQTSNYKFPEELENKFKENTALKTAFEALTPGRQRGYLLHFSQPIQPKTRESRIEKCLPRIFFGKGLSDR